MSPLTKLFVVLLVVLSLAQTAGLIVFVNQIDDYKKSSDANKALADSNTRALEATRNAAEAAIAGASEREQLARKQVEDMKQSYNALQQQIVDKDTQLGQAKSQAALQAADLTRLAEALRASEGTKSKLQDHVAELRGGNDKLVAQNAQLNQSVTELTNKLEVTERERKFLAEQLTEAKVQVDKQAQILKDMGVTPTQLVTAGARLGAPAINGVIRAVRPIAGIPYATISVGSADNVARGMEFKVVNRGNGDFLGILTVDSVELNEATGRLSGPRISEIAAGAEVKTQL